MKIFKKIIAWAMLSLILQVSGLFILNNFVFQHTSEFKSKKIEVEKTSTKDINANIPTNAESINISYDGKYLTYYSNESLFIEDTKNLKLSFCSNVLQILFCHDLTSSNALVINSV